MKQIVPATPFVCTGSCRGSTTDSKGKRQIDSTHLSYSRVLGTYASKTEVYLDVWSGVELL